MQIGNLKEKKKEKIWILLQIPRTNETARGKKKNRHSLCVMHFRRELSDITPNRQT